MSETSPETLVSRFLRSMIIDYEKWHDGIGYDLDALRAASPAELRMIEAALIDHSPRDWRDVEALALIDTPTARAAVERALHDADPAVRREAMHHAADKLDPAERERTLLKLLSHATSFGGLTEALDGVEEFHPPSVIDALLRHRR